jgi:hypothetical protein
VEKARRGSHAPQRAEPARSTGSPAPPGARRRSTTSTRRRSMH